MTAETQTGTYEPIDQEALAARIIGLERGDVLRVELTRPFRDHISAFEQLERAFFDARYADGLALKISYIDPMGGKITRLTLRVIEF